MKHENRQVRNIGDFITALRDTTNNRIVWFRGQKRLDWKLLPNIARPTEGKPNGSMDEEGAAIKRFKQNAGAFLDRTPSDIWEWIFLMQHHRGVTRLLDWSESPLVALYFALEHDADGHDAVVWCLDPMELNAHAGHNRKNPRDILAFGIDEALDNYAPDRVSQIDALMEPIAAIGPRNSRRMVAQSGTFTIIHADPKPIEEVKDSSHIWRLVIPDDAKENIREELKIVGFNEFMLFPDLETLAVHTKELLK